jgi:hypothetical protein
VGWWWRLVDWWRGPLPCEHEWRLIASFTLCRERRAIFECDRCGRETTLLRSRRTGT